MTKEIFFRIEYRDDKGGLVNSEGFIEDSWDSREFLMESLKEYMDHYNGTGEFVIKPAK